MRGGHSITIKSIETEYRNTLVYNIEVQDNHTYFVSWLGILVHNYDPKKGIVEKGDTGNKAAARINEYNCKTKGRKCTKYSGNDILRMNGLKEDAIIQPGQILLYSDATAIDGNTKQAYFEQKYGRKTIETTFTTTGLETGGIGEQYTTNVGGFSEITTIGDFSMSRSGSFSTTGSELVNIGFPGINIKAGKYRGTVQDLVYNSFTAGLGVGPISGEGIFDKITKERKGHMAGFTYGFKGKGDAAKLTKIPTATVAAAPTYSLDKWLTGYNVYNVSFGQKQCTIPYLNCKTKYTESYKDKYQYKYNRRGDKLGVYRSELIKKSKFNPF